MRQLLGRLAQLAVTLVVVTFLVSSMVELIPGDPAVAVIGENATPEQVKLVHAKLHLDEPPVERYVTWLGNAAKGDLGESLRTQEAMIDVIGDRIPINIELLLGAQVLALLYAIPAGIYAAYRHGRRTDRLLGVMSFGFISFPSFVLALFLVFVLAVQLHVLPISGYVPLAEDPVENIKSMLMPMLTIAASPAALYQRLLRNDMRATLQEDFILMAEAKGQSTLRILFRHALRPSMFSLMTLMGVSIAAGVAGSVIVESIFSLPGIGRLLFVSIGYHDVTAIQAVVAVIAVAYVVINGLVDVLYGVLDPRISQT